MIIYFASLINKLLTSFESFFKKYRIKHEEDRLYTYEPNDEQQEPAATGSKPKPKIIILKQGESMDTNLNLIQSEKTPTAFESAVENALLFGENMYFSAMAQSTSESLTDPAKAPANLTAEAYVAFCEYTAGLFAVAAAARQELNGIDA